MRLGDFLEAFPLNGAPHLFESRRLHGDGEFAACARFLNGRRWHELGTEELEKSYDCVSFVDIEAFVYYLPAFLWATLVHPNSMVADTTVSSITRRGREMLPLLTAAQATFVSRFFRFVAEREIEFYGEAEDAERTMREN